MSSGKGGTQTTTVKLPESIERQAAANQELANKVGSLPYAPYFGASVAGFQPAHQAAFDNMNGAAGAFGLKGSAGEGMPQSKGIGGFRGYSTEDLYNAGMRQVDPAVLKLYESFFFPNNGAQATPTSGKPSGGSGGNIKLGTLNPPYPSRAFK